MLTPEQTRLPKSYDEVFKQSLDRRGRPVTREKSAARNHLEQSNDLP